MYKEMDGPTLLAACRNDARIWAAAFQEIVVDQHLEIDEGLMIGWFANAIMNSLDIDRGGGPVVLPDGSAFFVADVGGSTTQGE